MIYLNLIWPAQFVAEQVWRFWFLVFGTIVLEWPILKYAMRYPWAKALLATILGNLVSCFAGTFIVMWSMVFADLSLIRFLPDAWTMPAEYIGMCLGSAALEALAIRLIFGGPGRKLLLPVLAGNLLSYLFLFFYTAHEQEIKEPACTDILYYLPNKRDLILLDKLPVHFDTARIELNYDKDGKRMYPGSVMLQIPFQQADEMRFQFCLHKLAEGCQGGMGLHEKGISFDTVQEQYYIVVREKSSNPDLGWFTPRDTDTLIFKRIREE